MFTMDLEKAEEPEINCQHPLDHRKETEFQKYIIFASLTTLKAFTVWITTYCGKLFKSWEYWTTLLPAEKPVCRSRSNSQNWTWKDRLPLTDFQGQTFTQIGKGAHQGCILLPCLFNLYAEYIMQNVRQIKHELESRLPGEISITSDMQMAPPLWQKERGK